MPSQKERARNDHEWTQVFNRAPRSTAEMVQAIPKFIQIIISLMLDVDTTGKHGASLCNISGVENHAKENHYKS